MREAVIINRNDKDAQFHLGILYLLKKNKQSALAQYNVVKSLDPELGHRLYLSIYLDKIVSVAKF
jgi:hypothetical protein